MKQVNLYEKYKKEIVPELMKDLGYKNVMQVPKLEKVVLNVGIGRHLKEANYADMVEKNLFKITGQQPVRTKAKQSISNFKIREGMEVGLSVTLRGPKMYYFLEKLLTLTFPRMRDFRGISDKSFDKQGNFAFGFKENISFPEVDASELEKVHGLQVNVKTTAKTREEGKALLTKLGFPFVK